MYAALWVSDSRNPQTFVYDLLVSHRAAAALLSLTRRFVKRLDEEKRTRGVVDFDDLLIRTLALLGDPAILERARQQFEGGVEPAQSYVSEEQIVASLRPGWIEFPGKAKFFGRFVPLPFVQGQHAELEMNLGVHV